MAFQASGPHAADRAMEAIASGYEELKRFPGKALWDKPMGKFNIQLNKEWRAVPKGVSVVIGCSTFPTWNSVPGIYASLITGIDPPGEVESALAAINTAHNQVSSDISLADASADQKIVQSKRAVEIETLKAQAEVEPLQRLAAQLRALKTAGGKAALDAYVRNVKLELYHQSQQVYVEERQ